MRLIAFALSELSADVAKARGDRRRERQCPYVGRSQPGTVLFAAHIGGIGYLVGPVIGTVLVTYLQTMLSNHTEIWQLYCGL